MIKQSRFLTVGRNLSIFCGLTFLVACGGSSNTSTQGPDNPESFVELPPWWETATPDFSDNPDRPVITIEGPRTIFVNLDEEYTDDGATATDLQDGDLTADIQVDNSVDTSTVGDYLIRYSVVDSSQTSAIDAVRIVRVVDESTTPFMGRPVGTSGSHLGYFEYIPADYGVNPDEKFPLLIYNHGNGANAVFAGTPESSIGNLLINAGPPLLIHAEKWDKELPFIVLSPQIGDPSFADPIERIDAFVEYAKATYNIDENRVYMTGWSQGGFISWNYAMVYPNKVAAAVSISGGFIFGVGRHDNICTIEPVPVWAFHGDADEVVDVSSSIDGIDAMNDRCTPTIPPKLTILQEQEHAVHHGVFNLTMMEGGNLEVSSDPQYDLYDQSLFEWLLSYSLDSRGE